MNRFIIIYRDDKQFCMYSKGIIFIFEGFLETGLSVSRNKFNNLLKSHFTRLRQNIRIILRFLAREGKSNARFAQGAYLRWRWQMVFSTRGGWMREKERQRKREKGGQKSRGQKRELECFADASWLMIPTSRCTIYSRYFYRRLFVQRAPKYQWQRRAVAVDHAWCCGEKKRRGEEEEEETVVEAKAKRATAITGDGKRGEKMIVASTQRVQACIYLCVASRCWAFVVSDDGRLSRETTSEAFASSSSSRLLLLLVLRLSFSHCRPASIPRYRTYFSRMDFSTNASIQERKRSLKSRGRRSGCGESCAIERFSSTRDVFTRGKREKS